MIPTIGIMIGGYIVLRCLELMAAPQDRFASKIGQAIIQIAAVLVTVFTVISIWGLVETGGTVADALKGLR